MNKPQMYSARFEDKLVHNDKYWQYSFELVEPTLMEFQSGQYVSVAVDEKGSRRSYSICNRSDIDHGFELLIDMEINGLGVNYFRSLEFGQEIKLIGPMGQFVLQENDNDQVVFIATGSGVAPFRSMILDLLQLRHDSRPITLYWGLRYVHQLFWQDEFEELAQNFPNFSFYPVISKPTPDWTLSAGHVTDLLDVHDFSQRAGFYICGSTNVIESVSKVLAEHQFQTSQIYHEKFF